MTTRATISYADELYHGDAFLSGYSPDGRRGVKLSHLSFVDLGAPDALDVDGICDGVDCSTTAATEITLLTTTLDVPRNITVDADGVGVDGVVTITGTDQYGQAMVEEITANGTTAVAGKKAFKELTSISVGVCTGADAIDIGWGNVFGLPFRVDYKKDVLHHAKTDGVADALTLVMADTDQDATAGDPRGTWVPTTTPDGTVSWSCLMHLRDLSSKEAVFGYDQYSG